ncbi:MAG: hypothetical protein SAK29_10760 [Scytonema sp. PMC 1069.18]|nr:hypothetical protein [Scytonema sp. PMC 1069.18]MEC4880057.1 hypothetical protein [Scytonema sp. PMC 1070.18]
MTSVATAAIALVFLISLKPNINSYFRVELNHQEFGPQKSFEARVGLLRKQHPLIEASESRLEETSV